VKENSAQWIYFFFELLGAQLDSRWAAAMVQWDMAEVCLPDGSPLFPACYAPAVGWFVGART